MKWDKFGGFWDKRLKVLEIQIVCGPALDAATALERVHALGKGPTSVSAAARRLR